MKFFLMLLTLGLSSSFLQAMAANKTVECSGTHGALLEEALMKIIWNHNKNFVFPTKYWSESQSRFIEVTSFLQVNLPSCRFNSKVVDDNACGFTYIMNAAGSSVEKTAAVTGSAAAKLAIYLKDASGAFQEVSPFGPQKHNMFGIKHIEIIRLNPASAKTCRISVHTKDELVRSRLVPK